MTEVWRWLRAGQESRVSPTIALTFAARGPQKTSGLPASHPITNISTDTPLFSVGRLRAARISHATGIPWEWPASFFLGASATPTSVVITISTSMRRTWRAVTVYGAGRVVGRLKIAAQADSALAGPGRDPCTSKQLRPVVRAAWQPRSRRACHPIPEQARRCMGSGPVPLARCAGDRRRDDGEESDLLDRGAGRADGLLRLISPGKCASRRRQEHTGWGHQEKPNGWLKYQE